MEFSPLVLGVWKERKNGIFRDREVSTNVLIEKVKSNLREKKIISKGGIPDDGSNSKDREKDGRMKR